MDKVHIELLMKWIHGSAMSSLGDDAEEKLRAETAVLMEMVTFLISGQRAIAQLVDATNDVVEQTYSGDPWQRGYASGKARRSNEVASILGHFSNDMFTPKVGKS